MKALIQRNGDTLAVPIPPVLAAQSGLAENSSVEVTLVAGKLVITPAPRKLSLEELLKGVTPENLHGEWNTGPAVGAEVW